MAPRPAPPSPAQPLLPQFYARRAVFITGATGFMGKVLVERLLSTCPDIGSLFLLMRDKKDLSPEKRLAYLKQSHVFDGIRQRCPHQLDKLVAIPGDVCSPGLGIRHRDMAQLRDVSVVFHSAATLKFNEPLRDAVNQNIRSVIRLMDVCDTLPKMQVLVHVSTAYSNTDRPHLEERVYPPPVQLQHLLNITEPGALPDDMLAQITPRYIAPKPNTYTFTKAMAETAVAERPHRTYNAAIFRPSVVVSSVRDPYPGWIENLNGPSGAVAATGKGLLRVLRCEPNARADLIPVDIAIDTLVAVAAHTALNPSGEVLVYNCCSGENPMPWHQFKRLMLEAVRRHPFDDVLWYPWGIITNNSVVHAVSEFLLQKMPMYSAHFLMQICGFKTQLNLVRVYQRLRAMDEVLGYFSSQEWSFATDNVRALKDSLTPQDRAIFNLDPNSIVWEEHVENFVKGSRKYLLKEKDENIDAAKQRMHKLYYIHKAVTLALVAFVCRLLLPSFLFATRRIQHLLSKYKAYCLTQFK